MVDEIVLDREEARGLLIALFANAVVVLLLIIKFIRDWYAVIGIGLLVFLTLIQMAQLNKKLRKSKERGVM